MISPAATTVAAAGRKISDTPRSLVWLVIALFFIWGGITSLNDILIPKLKDLFSLSYAEAMLTQFAFFTAYAVVSLPAGRMVGRIGYLKGIVAGLAVMAIGCLLFIPAAQSATYGIFLAALFVLAGGITILQVAANPLIANLGSPETSHSRLTFAQAFNSLGTTIAPYIGAKLILGSIATTDPATLSGPTLLAFQAKEAVIIAQTYICIALVLAIIALIFWWRRRLLDTDNTDAVSLTGSLALVAAQPRLAFGIAAIFVYVGAEVTIGSVLANYLMQPSTLALDRQSAGELIALYWGGAMVGRFAGAGLLRLYSPGKVLAAAAIGAGTLVLISALSAGTVSGWSLIAVGLMNSIMFPTIFSLALEGLRERSAQGSGLLCMAIVGGAIVPLAGGALADASTLAAALAVPVVCYLIIAGFGWFARNPASPPGTQKV